MKFFFSIVFYTLRVAVGVSAVAQETFAAHPLTSDEIQSHRTDRATQLQDALVCHNYPFPQNATYPYGLMPIGRNHIEAQQSYLTWKTNYVTTDGACGFRRVLFDDMSSTYSEGIGYGMLLAVNFDDQPLFDDLLGYYSAHLDQYGLMHWWLGNNCQVLGSGCATDADEDVAYALLLADRQWCSNGTINYLQRAVTQINRLYQRCVERNTYVLKPGDGWGGSSITNPSYFAPAFYRAFRAATNNSGWDLVIDKCYQILAASAHPTTGLVPDWCQADGQPSTRPYYYYYDAARTPWRIALDYVWFGNPQAKAFCEKISGFARGIGSVNIREGYYLDGTPMNSRHINVFVGPFGAGSMGTGTDFQAFCDSAYLDNVATVPPSVAGNYFNMSLRTLTLFLQTGNFFNAVDSTTVLPPVAPLLLSPANGTTGLLTTVTLRWRTSAGASTYRLHVATDSTFSTLLVNDSTLTDTVKALSGLLPHRSYHWRVQAKNSAGWSAFGVPFRFTTSGSPTVVEQGDGKPPEFVLYQNFPNPFNPSTTIRYAVPHDAFVRLEVFNTIGMSVALLVSGPQQAGYHDAVFQADGLASGVYFFRLRAGHFTSLRKLVLMR